MPKISVIVPVYNTEKYLPRCLDSLLRQTYRDFEILLIDDGSVDASGKICGEYAEKDERIKVIYQENRGQAQARNRGIDIAMESESTYLAFVDSDDWVAPNYFEALIGVIGELKISSCLFAENNATEINIDKIRVVDSEEYYCKANRLPFVIWGKLFDKALFQSLRFPDVKKHEDTRLVYRLLFQTEKIAVVFAPLYCYFQNSDGVTAAAWSPERLLELEAMDRQRAFFEQNGYEKALRHCVITEAKMMKHQLSEMENGYPDEKKRMNIMLRRLMKTYRLKRSDICLK